ncbi:energy transducer TonB [Fundidesulfovibrio putealis]|uniref:energy transducer TonB n=1 Tax=Fundidesulfovibrio putealis TaxID=270496 RepID=UPI00146FC603|nr:energy transducer TonB [Fundidesulfovibrio putealis]
MDAKPKLIRHVEPDYPESARKRALSGKVMARFVVDESGLVHEPTVSSSDPPGVFDDSVIEAVRRWKFEPARHKGKAVKVVVTVPVKFDISNR